MNHPCTISLWCHPLIAPSRISSFAPPDAAREEAEPGMPVPCLSSRRLSWFCKHPCGFFDQAWRASWWTRRSRLQQATLPPFRPPRIPLSVCRRSDRSVLPSRRGCCDAAPAQARPCRRHPRRDVCPNDPGPQDDDCESSSPPTTPLCARTSLFCSPRGELGHGALVVCHVLLVSVGIKVT